MTLVFDRRDVVPDGPQMHAIVIGIGRFPHVENAPQTDRKACPDSAHAVIDFLLEHRDDFDAPLATIECLLSDPRVEPGDETYPHTDHDPREIEAVEHGTHVAVEKTCDEWLSRCREGDVLFFYGASHGVATESETALLVCEDYKINPKKKSYGLLSVDSIHRSAPAMCKSSASWVFLDACQEVSRDLLGLKDDVSPLRPAEANVSEITQYPVKSVSAVGSHLGGDAYADKAGGVAYFTQALIAALSGCCVKPHKGEWYVGGGSLSDRIETMANILYDRAYPLKTSRLGGDSGAGYWLLRPGHPTAPVAVSTWPEIRMARAQFAEIVTRNPPVEAVAVREDTAPIWRCRVSLATLELEARMMPHSGPMLTHSFVLFPDGVELDLP